VTRSALSRTLAGVAALFFVAYLRADDPVAFRAGMTAAAVLCVLHAARDPYEPVEGSRVRRDG